VLLAVGKIALFLVTFYCTCADVCTRGLGITATGVSPVEGWTIACDPRVLPMGSIVRVAGFGERMCQDTGSRIKGRRIDVYVQDHGKAVLLGLKRLEVEVVHRPVTKRRPVTRHAGVEP